MRQTLPEIVNFWLSTSLLPLPIFPTLFSSWHLKKIQIEVGVPKIVTLILRDL
jgi:hypothetical protein